MDPLLARNLSELIRVVTEVTKLIICSLAAATVAVTLSKSGVFKPMRLAIKSRSRHWFFRWLGKLLDCPYCTSHWTAFAVALVFQPRPVAVHWAIDWLLSAFAMVVLAAWWAKVIFNTYEGLLQGDPELSDINFGQPIGDSLSGTRKKRLD
jgi:hypothetical protein